MAIPDRKYPPKGVELLFAHEMVRPYLTLLSECSNHVTLEATTGTLQNMASGEWVVSTRHYSCFYDALIFFPQEVIK